MGETVRWPKLEAVCKIFEDLPTAVAWAENRIFLGAVHKWYHQKSYEGVHEKHWKTGQNALFLK